MVVKHSLNISAYKPPPLQRKINTHKVDICYVCSIWGFGVIYIGGDLMLCTCINMVCVTSDMSHTSGDGALVMRTGALEPALLIGLRRWRVPTAEKGPNVAFKVIFAKIHVNKRSQPRWLSGLMRSHVHSLMIARRSLCPEKLGSNPGQGSKEINFSGWHGLDMSITVTKRR